jgi:hypothetical protein
MIRGSLQKWGRASYYHIIIDCIDKQEVKLGAVRNKELEIKLRKLFEINEKKMFEINEKIQAKKKRWLSKSDADNVIRRRKGEPDKFIPQKANK